MRDPKFASPASHASAANAESGRSKPAPRAIIIGASLSGLFAATSLRAIGWDVQVFERSPNELSSRGGGVVLQPDVIDTFNFAGLTFPQPLGIPSGDRIYLDRSNKVVHRTYMPQTQTSWNMLYTTMKKSLPEGIVHPGELFLRFEQHDGKVSAYFDSGRVETGDILIGADGARSAVRFQLLPEIEPVYAGYVAWRGLVPESELEDSAKDVLKGVFAFQQGPGHLLLEYMVPGLDGSTTPGERRWNWVWYRKVSPDDELGQLLTDNDGERHAYSLPPGAVKNTDFLKLLADAKEMLAPTFQTLLAATDEPFLQAILDLRVKKMVFDRVILIGDAAFVPRPHTAGSTAKAAANARTLAMALSASGTDIDAKLQIWENSQLEAGASMTDWGISAGDRIMNMAGGN